MLDISITSFNITFTLRLRIEQYSVYSLKLSRIYCLFYFIFLFAINKLHMFIHACISNGKLFKYFANPRILELMNYVIVFWSTVLL